MTRAATALMTEIRGLSRTMRATLDAIAVNEDGGHNPATLRALENRGLIESYEEGDGFFFIKRWRVPLSVHVPWAAVCAEEFE